MIYNILKHFLVILNFRIRKTLFLCKWCDSQDQPMPEKYRDENGRFNKPESQQSDIIFLLHTILQVKHANIYK